ncbi:MAG: LptF/LptG family permease [Deltaproteobacteria bacterium]|nr:LptF/LptG family permease [Deltaproteobacteria bacterium]
MSIVLIGYLIKKLLVRFSLLTGLLVAVYCVIDYVETMSNVGAANLYWVYGCKIPEILTHMLPLSVCASVLLTVVDFRKTGEWHAIQMAGVSERRLQGILLCLPLLLLPFIHMTAHQWAPNAMAVFESAVNQHRMTPLTHYRQNDWIVARSSSNQMAVRVRRSPSGRANELSVQDDQTTIHRWRSSEHRTENVPFVPDSRAASQSGLFLPVYGTNGIFASSVSTDSLRQMAKVLRGHGAPVKQIESALALRSSIVVASLVVPVVALLLLVAIPYQSARFFAIALSVGVSGVYWVVLMLLWAWGTAVDGRVSVIPELSALIMLVGGLAGAWAARPKQCKVD